MTYYFYDTCSLLLRANDLFDKNEHIALSSITLSELENIKTSANKDADVKYAARRLLHTLDENKDKYDTIIFKTSMLEPIVAADIEVTNDTKILACALAYDCKWHPDEVVFVTNDLALKMIANLFFGEDSIMSIDEEAAADKYTGFIERWLTNDELGEFYAHPNENQYGLLPHQYLILRDSYGEPVDSHIWTGTTFEHIKFNTFRSSWFGDIKPYQGDIYQQLLCDSFTRHKITMIKGPAGTGKSTLALGFLMFALEHGQIDKIIIFCNTVATKGAAKLGFYPGTRDEKLLDSQIGNFLNSKLGSDYGVEQLMNQDKLLLLPCSDIRGFDTTGMKAGIYVTEAQNMDVNLMKLMLQRIGEDGICIIDGDCDTQVDDIAFAGANNGMRRASKVFRGEEIYGEVTLQNIYRSQIARIAERM